jgi:hypothetical protein
MTLGDELTRDEGSESFAVQRCKLGFGLFATRPFSAGEFLFTFTGPTISLAQAIAKGDNEGNALQIGPELYVDLQPPSVFANHSCNPNACVQNDVRAFALRDMAAGEEVRYDYSTTMSERRWSMNCLCGAASCRGVVTDFHELPLDTQERYLGLNAVQAFIVQEVHARKGSPPPQRSGNRPCIGRSDGRRRHRRLALTSLSQGIAA